MERQLESSPKPKPTGPSDPIVSRREEANARAYEQFEHELAHVNERLSNLVDDAQHSSADAEAGNPISDAIGTATGNISGRLPPASTLTPVKFPREKVMSAITSNATGSDMDNPLIRMRMFRPTAGNNVGVPDDRPSQGRRYVVSLGLLLAACVVAAVAWQSFDGDKVRQLRLVLTSSLGGPGQPNQSTVQADAANAAGAQPAAPAQTAVEDAEPATGALAPELTQAGPSTGQADTAEAALPKPSAPAQIAAENVAPAAAALPPELARLLRTTDTKATPPQPAPPAQTAPVAPTTGPLPAELAQSLQTITRDLARVEQGIEQLKTSQEQISRDNAKLAEQLKASQEQMARLVAKPSEHTLPPKTAARPPRPILTR